ncbi:MAG: DUF1501 domain-containing protein [Acidobacteria bacterium]|nr:MAG: DUF1501 domain-containing protein [Acidobacteriota bacterium]REK05866.1 MAG: DUF1501 domain-containing protein [Acidobacteriota bacterium]
MLIRKNPLAPFSRRDLLKAGAYGLGVSTGLPGLLTRVARAQTTSALDGSEKSPDRILVVVELAGGNDGLNTIVPYGHDAYYRARPKLGVARDEVLKLDEELGLHPSCTGLESLFKEGKMAVVHGCGYPDPNLSHFTAMGWWHTGVPHGNAEYGWLGRFADAYSQPIDNYIVNVASQQSMAVTSEMHSPVVFDDPERFGRFGTAAQQKVFETFGEVYPTGNSSLDFVNRVSRTATAGAASVRNACAEYRSLVDYGSDNDLTLDLKKVAAMIAAELPTRIYYVQMGGFDTHAAQAGSHNTLLIYMSDALRGFITDIERLGRGDDVAVMVFTEFGRRVEENASGGTDHGTATPMFVLGNRVAGGFYGQHPSLEQLHDGNLVMTTDFRRVYATMLQGFMGYSDTDAVLKGEYPPIDLWT